MIANGYCGDPSYLSRPSCLAAGKTWHLANIPGPDLNFGAGRSVMSLASGFNNIWMCAVLDNFELKCWGDNSNGQLGYGDASVSSDYTTIDLGASLSVQSVQIAASHVCALTNSGAVKCWGINSYGKLGIGHYTDTPTPTIVTLTDTATQIATHNSHACALLANGSIQCWGHNTAGRLGSGASLSTLAESPSPVTVVGLGANAAQVGTGADFTCALLVDGTVKCWGSPTNGRLGSAVSPATYCSDGIQTTTTACTAAGGIWNVSLYGDCSNGISTSQAACQAVSNGTWAHCSNGIAVTSGACTGASVWNPSLYQYCTTGATPTSAATFCTNTGGSLGNYGYCSDSSYRTRPACLGAGKTWHVYTQPGPAIDLGNVPATQIAVSNSGACALLQGGSVRCWGQNNYLQIGVGDTTTTNNYLQPAAAIDFGSRTVQKLAAGLGHYCAILDDQTLRCWGGGLSPMASWATHLASATWRLHRARRSTSAPVAPSRRLRRVVTAPGVVLYWTIAACVASATQTSTSAQP
jgi:alpha-tubulin suppressor-like RCC1 family protein